MSTGVLCIMLLASCQLFGLTWCQHAENPTRARVELGDWKSKGKLDMFYNGHWGAVCARRWGKREATVACRMMGYNGSSVMPSTAYVYQHQSRLERSVHVIDSCEGTELSLDECGEVTRKYLCGMAPGHFLVGVDCDPEPDILAVNLVAVGWENAGLVDILTGSSTTMRHICGSSWGQREADVACRQLGFHSGSSVPLEINSSLLRGNLGGRIEINHFECGGEETSLGQCVHYPPGDGPCEDTRGAAGVICGKEQTNFRVATSHRADEGGWVEVYMLDRWSDLVQDTWSGLEATVVCRMLGYEWGAGSQEWYGRAGVKRPSLRFEGSCNGDEISLIDCNITKWRMDLHNPDDSRVPTAVRCFNGSRGPSRPIVRGLDDDASENDTLIVTCEVDGGDSDVTGALQCPGAHNQTDGPVRVRTGQHVIISTSLTASYMIYNTKRCTCAAVNDLGWQATVERRPNIVFGPSHVRIILPSKIKAGEAFALVCEVDSNPSSEITWILGSRQVEGADRKYNRLTEFGFRRTYSRWYIKAESAMTGELVTCLAKNPLTNQTLIDSKVIVVGHLPQQAHIGLSSSKGISPLSFLSYIQSSLGSTFQRRHLRTRRVHDGAH